MGVKCTTSSFHTSSVQLGLSQAGYAVGNAAFGEGTGPILWDNVVCNGNEKTIQECSRSPTVDCESCKLPSRHVKAVLWCNFIGMHVCFADHSNDFMHAGTHREDVGVICGSNDQRVNLKSEACRFLLDCRWAAGR